MTAYQLSVSISQSFEAEVICIFPLWYILRICRMDAQMSVAVDWTNGSFLFLGD
jgi:hypothetical protein